MRRLLVKIAVVSSGATAALLALVGGASAATTTDHARVQTTDQVVAELASPDATVSGLLKCWAHGRICD
jgi:hypothetical protein